MKNICITAVTIFAFATAPVLAGEASMSMDNAFSFSKSSQSAPVSGNSANSAGSFGSAPESYQGPSAGILLGLLAIVIVIFAASGGGGNSTTTGGYGPA